MARHAEPAPANAKSKPAIGGKRSRESSGSGELRKRLAEAWAQHAAISEILKVMSASPSDVRPVLDAVAERAARLCEAPLARVLLVDGDEFRAIAEYSLDGTSHARTVPIPLKRTTIIGRAVLDRATIHHDDVVPLLETEYPDALNARRLGLRAVLVVPLVREDKSCGVILLWRREPGLFSHEQVALVQTFAEQATIAIENVRLFNETKEALEQQTATSDILKVISRSQTDVQPVFDTIAAAALRLCAASSVTVFTFDGELIRIAALVNMSPEGADAVRGFYPRPPGRDNAASRAVMTCSVITIPDVLEDRESAYRDTPVASGFRSVLAVPLLREGGPIGAISVGRPEPGPFPETQIALLQTFADQAVIAIENVRLFTELTDKNRALTQAHARASEALERQTATSEVLRVISSSPTDVQPVFETIVASAARLCGAESAAVYRFDGEIVHFAAGYNFSAEALEAARSRFPRPLRETDHLRRVVDGSVLNMSDVEKDPHTTSGGSMHRARGVHGTVFVPMVRKDRVIGVIGVSRREVGSFASERVELLKTFADQAVIAIENVRLFTELQSRNRDLTATSEILRVISISPTNVQPVFDAIVKNAVQLCEARYGAVFRLDRGLVHLAAHHNLSETLLAEWFHTGPMSYPMAPNRGHASGRAILSGAAVQVPDILADKEYLGAGMKVAGFRGLLAVPLLHHGQALGAIVIYRTEPGEFADKHAELLKTFADQAVIAIENVRLFNETKEALDQQTATSEILRVISQSPTDVQPVFDTIAAASMRLCRANSVTVTTFDGELLHLAAVATVTPEGADAVRKLWPRPTSRDTAGTRAVLTRTIVVIPDVLDDPDYKIGATAVATGFRSLMSVPLLREGIPIGAIAVGRPEPGSFPEKQIALLQTFADQAVIAIENVRLFTELEARTTELTRSVQELKALGEVGQAVSSTLDLETVLSTIVSRATQLAGMDGGSIWEYDEAREEFHLHATDRLPDELVEVLQASPIRKGEGALGRLAMTGEPVEIQDFADERSYQSRLREILIRCGYRSVLAIPLLREDHLLGALAVNRSSPGGFAPEVTEVLKTFATQSALAIQNARLYREIEVKSNELEAASRHKSEFLANMSHELRTPLNAILGFSEILSERMFGDINEKQAEYVGDILESGHHLLSLINDILDLSKIEAGRMELELSDFDLPSAIENTLILVRERAQRLGVTLACAIDERLGTVRADERKLKQVLLNLLSNALKFTPEGGKISVSATSQDGMAEISVRDTGVGIAPEDQEAVFEEFRQVGTASKKVEGTGLGLAISRRFVELHGGKIWVTSQVGSGSTFAFALPL